MGVLRSLFERRASVTPGTKLSNPSSWLIDLLGGTDSTTGIKVTEDNALTSSAVWACVRALAESVATLPLQVFRQYPDGSKEKVPDSTTGIKVTEDNALTSSAVWACVRALAESVATLPLQVFRQYPDGSKEKVPDYPLYPVLHDQPNPEMTSVEWREASMGHLLLWGNSYSEIEFDQAMRPVALWPLRPDRMQMWRDPETGELVYIYSLYSGGGSAYFSADQILHIRTLGRDGLLGLSPIGQMREAIGLSLAMERYGGALFGNGAQPGGILTTQGVLSENAQRNLRNSWEEQHRGPGNAGRVAVLEQGVTWQQTGMPPEDAQFIMSRQFSLTEIARIYRMPPHMLQELTRATNNNIEHLSLEFVTYTLRPYLVRYEQAFQSRLFPGRDQKRYYALFQVDGLLRGDLASRYAAYAVGRQWGWLSADDVRAKEDMNPLPDGDGKEYLKPMNMVDAGTPLPLPPVSPPPTSAGGGGNGDSDESKGSQAARMLEAFLEDVGRRLTAREDADICRAARKHLARRRWAELPEWLEGFYREHRGFVVQQVLPAFRVVDPELAEELAGEVAERHLGELRAHLQDCGDLASLEARLEHWEAQRPARFAQREAKRALRLAWDQAYGERSALANMGEALIRLAEPRQAPSVTVPVTLPAIEVQPPALNLNEGAIQTHVAPTECRIEEGAIQFTAPPPPDIHVDIAPPPPAEFRMEPGAVQVEVQAPPAPPPAEVRVDVQPPNLSISEGAVHVDVQPPPAPPPAEVRVDVQSPPPAEVNFGPDSFRVDVAPPPPAELRIEPGAVQVEIQPPPPTELHIAEGAVQVEVQAPPPPPPAEVRVDVHAPPAPPPAEVNVEVQPAPPAAITFQEGAIRVGPAPRAPAPRLDAAKAKLTDDKTKELQKRRRRTPRKPPTP